MVPSAHALTIALDVGHSLARPGALSAHGVPEFSFNRALALVVRQVFQARGWHPVLIGVEGTMQDLRARPQIAMKAGAAFFLSIHHDSVQPQYLDIWDVAGKRQHYSDRFRGFSLFVSRTNLHPQASLTCAAALGQALQQAGLHASTHHAEPIAGENRPFADAVHGVHYYDDLVVLKTAMIPAVLLEAGVIVHRQEETWLQQAATRTIIATALANGMAQCRSTLP
jgi:N-acetylmuramoyl-L-alanine amidase